MPYKVEYTELNWECECCGNGTHEIVKLYLGEDLLKAWSRNDQFGGTLHKEDHSFPVEYGDGESFAKGIYTGLFMAGQSVFYEDHKS